MEKLSILCADVGSIKKKNFGWASSIKGNNTFGGNDIDKLALAIADSINGGYKVALGFECPLYLPVREAAMDITNARSGEGNRSWSASAGSIALAIGLVETVWVMKRVKNIIGKAPKAILDWSEFLSTDGVFLWEAFVSGTSKGKGHSDDAAIAVDCFQEALPNPEKANALEEAQVFSLIGAASLRAGWSDDPLILSKPCLVIKA